MLNWRSDNIIQTCYGVAWIEENVIFKILTMDYDYGYFEW